MRHAAIFMILSGLLALAPLATLAADEPRTGSYSTSFDVAAPYATAKVISKRMMLGEVYRSTLAEAARQGMNLNAHTVDPGEETWDVYVPADYDGSKPYGVLVWVSSAPAAELPERWQDAVAKHKLIYIAARASGDNQPILDRRVPLALHGLNGIVQNYSIDPKRLYIGGDGGGAIVASNTALGFADVFAGGVFLSDGPHLGTVESPVPVASLLQRARQNHYAVLAARDNTIARGNSLQALESMNDLCIDQVIIVNRPESGDEGLLDTGLGYITQPRQQITANVCVSQLQAQAAAAVNEVRALIESNELEEATQAWRETYLQYGGLVDKEMSQLKTALEAKKQQRAPGT